MKKIAILQSNYIPWKGYFDIINSVDEFILLDEVQYTKNDWRNRNKIKTPNGLSWLSIPVSKSGHLHKKINEVTVTDRRWNTKHCSTIVQYYSKTAHFAEYREWLEKMYLDNALEYLSDINYFFINAICTELGIKTKIAKSSEYEMAGEKNERLINFCQQAGATEYLSGPAAKNYLDEEKFMNAGIKVSWMDYSGYPEYEQLYPPFEHGATVLDLILNTGKDAPKYMKSFEK
ncbi:MAG: WbqC family protein [Victivallaceae bacterium]